jgi:soluble epoxide hydrolase / lipid-phosphate phosphatase
MAAEMSLSKLKQNTLKVSRGHTYTYYTSPARASKPTILLFHGWPDTAALFAGLINNYLIPAGYGVVALDCLGYGGTSKPSSMHEYRFDAMAADAAEILDHESIAKVVSLGHDWGSAMAQRFYYFNKSRVIGLIILNVALVPPSATPFDLDATNKATEEIFGYGIYQYWKLFTADDGSQIERDNIESVYSVAFGDPHTWKQNWTAKDGMRNWLTAGKTQPTLPFAQGEHKRDFVDRLSKPGAFEAANNWYKAYTFGVQTEAEKKIAGEPKVEVPTLFWGGEQDFVCRIEAIGPVEDAGLIPDLTKLSREGGHWALLEKPKEFGEDLVGWLGKTFS